MGGGSQGSLPAEPRDLLWYYVEVDNGDREDPVKQRGPFALGELRALWAQNAVLDPDTFVWADGMGDFKRIRECAALKRALANSEPPSPGRAVQVDISLTPC